MPHEIITSHYKKFTTLLYKYCFLIMAILFLQSCKVAYKSLPGNISPVKEIEGIYANSPSDTTKPYALTLWRVVNWRSEIKEGDIYAKVDLPNTKSVRVTFIRHDKKIGERIIKGKFQKDDCFYSKRKVLIIPFIPIFYKYDNKQFRMYKLGNDLIVEDTEYTMAGTLFMAADNRMNNIFTYESQS